MRKLQRTDDGSYTLYDEEFQTCYHSVFGAKSESKYVFLQQGKISEYLQQQQEVRILEIGTGTGLNLFLTAELAMQFTENQIFYYGYEPRPLPAELLENFYRNSAFPEEWTRCLAEQKESFCLNNVHVNIFYKKWQGEVIGNYDVIYYDAFGPKQHPEMWTEKMLLGIYNNLKQGGKAVTFSITGNTKRILKKHSIPFYTPKGFGKKREMLVIEKH